MSRPPIKPPSGAAFTTPKKGKINPRIVLYAQEKWGKTSFAAHMPNAIGIIARDERGYQPLVDAGLVPSVPVANVESWSGLLETVRDVTGRKHSGTLFLDSLTGFERLCHEHVCETQFGGDWGPKGFLDYHKGFERSGVEWMKLLQALDAANAAGTTIVMLAHATVKTHSPPDSAAFDRAIPECNAKTWGPTAKWADAILMGQFYSQVEVDRQDAKRSIAEQHGKAVGKTLRVVRIGGRASDTCGNRFGGVGDVYLQGDHTQAWNEVSKVLFKEQTNG